jgi:VCBS repeat-containing protein
MVRKAVLFVLALALAVILITGILPGFAAAQDGDGNPVSPDAAKQAAVNHMNKMLVNRVIAETGVLPSAADAFAETAASINFTETKEGKNVYYVINLDPEGWVIVSADYVAYPIIAHSDEGSYSEENHPPAFDAWMENVKDEIYSAIENDLTPLPEASAAWDSFNAPAEEFFAEASAESAGIPLAAGVSNLMATTWSQGGKSSFDWAWAETYDYYCPWEKNWWGFYRVSPVGCVATATGQVMKYWGWPATGEGSHTWDPPYAPTEDDGTGYASYDAYTVNFAARNYDWANMPNKVTSSFWDIDANEKKVASVLRDIGVAVHMDYTPWGSGAGLDSPGARYALETYFRYDRSATHTWRGGTSYDAWGDKLRVELNAGRPVIYGGYNPSGGGHAFVCDGYNDSNQFHFNWGWNGSYDGYYYLNDLTPGSHNYTNSQSGIFNVKPDTPPIAVGDIYTTNEDQTLSIGAPGVLGNDIDLFGQSLTAVRDSNPSHGSLTLRSNGSFTYTPHANYVGADSFTYHARDGRYNSATVAVVINVLSVNDPPTAGNNAYSVNEDQTLSVSAPGVLGNDNDPDGNPITAVKDTNPANGTLTLNANGSFTYKPNANYNGSDSFTYHARDSHGANSNIATVSITINPVNDPPVAVGADITLELDATGYVHLNAGDVDGGSYDPDGDTVTLALSQEDFTCAHRGSNTVTLIVSDPDGATDTYDITVTVLDVTPPSISGPPDAILEYPADTSPDSTGYATGSDTCGAVTITYSDVSTPMCGSTETISRTWTATDESGNTASCVQTIAVVDTTPPSITGPADVTLEYPADTSPDNTGYATGSDTCSAVTITYSDVSTPMCGSTETISRTWTAEDECGNTSSYAQTIAVVDTTPPSITCPADVILECPADTSPEATGYATGSDTCSDVTITYSDVVTPSCGDTESTTRTWTAEDECGNTSSCVQTITVVDTTPPTIDVSVSPDILWPANHKMVDIIATVTVNDSCDQAPSIVLTSVVSNEPDDAKGNGDGNTVNDIQGADVGTEDYAFSLRAEAAGGGDGRIYTITYTVTDACGNSATAIVTVIVPHDQGKEKE